MIPRIIAIAFIFACTAVGWFILGGAVTFRTEAQDRSLRSEVGSLWGGPQVQHAPTVHRVATSTETVEKEEEGGRRTTETVRRERLLPHPLAGSDLAADVALEHRKKGLLWYPTYGVRFRGTYAVRNTTDEAAVFRIRYAFPEGASVLDDFTFKLDDEGPVPGVEGGAVVREVELAPGEEARFEVGYRSQGAGTWRYAFGREVGEVRDFRLALATDFEAVDFPPGTLSPTERVRSGDGWTLTWRYTRLVADVGLGVVMPERLNPGPWVSRVTFFAPVSLFLFFFLLFILSLRRGIRLHPMHYFFLGAAFFAFHLLLAYLVDHVSVHTAAALASVVSVGLVVSYMRLVTGLRFALVEVGGAQLVYLVGFAYTFFLEGYTGLTITALCVLTLFGVMQLTGRVDWETQFRSDPDPVPAG